MGNNSGLVNQYLPNMESKAGESGVGSICLDFAHLINASPIKMVFIKPALAKALAWNWGRTNSYKSTKALVMKTGNIYSFPLLEIQSAESVPKTAGK